MISKHAPLATLAGMTLTECIVLQTGTITEDTCARSDTPFTMCRLLIRPPRQNCSFVVELQFLICCSWLSPTLAMVERKDLNVGLYRISSVEQKWWIKSSLITKRVQDNSPQRKIATHKTYPKSTRPILIRQLAPFRLVWLCMGLTKRQPLWVILCCLQGKGRKEIEEIVEKMKKRDKEERGAGMKVKKQKK